MGLADKTGIVQEDGSIPHVKEAMMSDAIGTTIGAALGSSTISTYVESASGVAEAWSIRNDFFCSRYFIYPSIVPLSYIYDYSKCCY